MRLSPSRATISCLRSVSWHAVPPRRRAIEPLHAPHEVRAPIFGCSTLVPAPLAFPRAATASALEDHARLTDRYLEAVLFRPQSRELLAVPGVGEAAVGYTCRTLDGQVIEGLMLRAEAVNRTSGYYGLKRELLVTPEEPAALTLLVEASGAISLQQLELHHRARAPRLTVLERDVLVEPYDQQHWTTGAWTVTRWVGSDGTDREPRYAWTETPSDAKDETEAIDRLVTFHEARIRRQVRAFLHHGVAPRRVLVIVRATWCCGDRVGCFERRYHSFILTEFPSLAHAIDANTSRRSVPVVVVANGYGGLRWLSVEKNGAMSFDPLPAVVARAMNVVDPDETNPFSREPITLVPSCRPGIEGELDRLVDLSPAALDAEIILAGFEPAIERSMGPGLRESVLAAIWAQHR